MQWTVRLEAKTNAGEVKTTELVTFSRPAVVSTLAEVGLMLDESKMLLSRLQASMLCGQVAAYAADHRVCAACGVMQPLKDRRTRRLQTLFSTVEVDAPRFKLCRRPSSPMVTRTVSPVCALLTARCTPELERVQAELDARTSFRDVARILDTLLPVLPANHESVRIRRALVRSIDCAAATNVSRVASGNASALYARTDRCATKLPMTSFHGPACATSVSVPYRARRAENRVSAAVSSIARPATCVVWQGQ